MADDYQYEVSDHLNNEISDHLEIKSPCLYLVIMIIAKNFSLGIKKIIIFYHYPSNFRSGLDLTWARPPLTVALR